jgi:hypothetical protein
MEYGHFGSAYAYARKNGYKGTYDEYVEFQYQGYRTICKRCDIKPMTKRAWLDR